MIRYAMSFYTQPQGAHRHPVPAPWLNSAPLPSDFCFLTSALSFANFQLLTNCPRLATLSVPFSFQQLTTIKWNYPMRIVHPERTGAPGEPGLGSLGWGSEGSLCEPEADTTKIFVLLSFQQVTTIKSCNSCVLITIQIAPGWVYPPAAIGLKFYFKSLASDSRPSLPASRAAEFRVSHFELRLLYGLPRARSEEARRNPVSRTNEQAGPSSQTGTTA
jgi:hypothetical protein